MTPLGKAENQRTQLWILALLAFIEIGLMAMLFKVPSNTSSTELLAAICAMGFLMFLTGRSPTLFSLTSSGLRVELERVQSQVLDNKQSIVELTLLSMGAEAFGNLDKLATGNFGQYKLEQFKGLWGELYYLRNKGYVMLKPGTAPSIHDIPTDGENLSHFIEVTDEGRRYLQLRKEVIEKQSSTR